ncbi:MAG: hypothetical protein KKF12_04725 [Proteobacteria bacterium]|nr:hypothetical protein [Desulfobacula sp.]MBU4130104.1 hypothetical protein [Pseudomonadota bacterium]
MKKSVILRVCIGAFFVLFIGCGCSVRYCDSEGHDTLIGFPPMLNEVETAAGSNERITWRRIRRTGVGLNFSAHSFGLLMGYEHVFLVWVQGDGNWELFYSSGKAMSITELSLYPGDPMEKK